MLGCQLFAICISKYIKKLTTPSSSRGDNSSSLHTKKMIYVKAGSNGPFLRIRFYSVQKIGPCEHIKGGLPTLGFVSLDKR